MKDFDRATEKSLPVTVGSNVAASIPDTAASCFLQLIYYYIKYINIYMQNTTNHNITNNNNNND